MAKKEKINKEVFDDRETETIRDHRSYGDKLKDPRWQRKRLEVMNRDNFTCLMCGSTEKTLHIHHKKYSGEPWEADNNNLQTLCEDCHFAIEQMKWFEIWKIIRNPVDKGIIILYGQNENHNVIIVFWNIVTREFVCGTDKNTILRLFNERP